MTFLPLQLQLLQNCLLHLITPEKKMFMKCQSLRGKFLEAIWKMLRSKISWSLINPCTTWLPISPSWSVYSSLCTRLSWTILEINIPTLNKMPSALKKTIQLHWMSPQKSWPTAGAYKTLFSTQMIFETGLCAQSSWWQWSGLASSLCIFEASPIVAENQHITLTLVSFVVQIHSCVTVVNMT